MKSKAFTLIELTIVVLIIAILASIIFVSLNKYKGSARDARAKENMNQIGISADKIYNNKGVYKSDLLCCSSGCNDEVRTNCEEVKKMTGSYPDIYSDDGENFCAKVKLSDGNYYCIDSEGVRVEESSVICAPGVYKCK